MLRVGVAAASAAEQALPRAGSCALGPALAGVGTSSLPAWPTSVAGLLAKAAEVPRVLAARPRIEDRGRCRAGAGGARGGAPGARWGPREPSVWRAPPRSNLSVPRPVHWRQAPGCCREPDWHPQVRRPERADETWQRHADKRLCHWWGEAVTPWSNPTRRCPIAPACCRHTRG